VILIEVSSYTQLMDVLTAQHPVVKVAVPSITCTFIFCIACT